MNSYPFNKSPNQFNNEEKHFNSPDGKAYHGVTITNKKAKKGSSDDYASYDFQLGVVSENRIFLPVFVQNN